MPLAVVISFRLGGRDGVSVEAAKWCRALQTLGYRVRTVAGEGPVDRLVPALAIDATAEPSAEEVQSALADADLVVVENLCSLPLNPPAARVVAECCRDRPTLLHHHDLPWQRPQFAHHPPPPDDPRWWHVTINELSRKQLAEGGIEAVTLYNAFDTAPAPGRRARTREALGVSAERLVLQPTRALERKNVPGGLAVAEQLGAIYWLLGTAEEGFGPKLDGLLAAARCPVIFGWGTGGELNMADAYAACDVVVLPSTWEGFGNPTIESAIHRRPLVVGSYPVADELLTFGFAWFRLEEVGRLAAWLERPDPGLLEHNEEIARRHFSADDLPERLAAVLGTPRSPGPARS